MELPYLVILRGRLLLSRTRADILFTEKGTAVSKETYQQLHSSWNVVISTDQIIVASRNKAGPIENPGLRSKWFCLLERGEVAFSKRQKKYRLSTV